MFLASGVRIGALALVLGLPGTLLLFNYGLTRETIIATGVNLWAVGVGIAAILLAVASGAAWVPARRASRVDPATTLRVE
jgi:ABC-type lipoprotein release transport system permease subunit